MWKRLKTNGLLRRVLWKTLFNGFVKRFPWVFQQGFYQAVCLELYLRIPIWTGKIEQRKCFLPENFLPKRHNPRSEKLNVSNPWFQSEHMGLFSCSRDTYSQWGIVFHFFRRRFFKIIQSFPLLLNKMGKTMKTGRGKAVQDSESLVFNWNWWVLCLMDGVEIQERLQFFRIRWEYSGILEFWVTEHIWTTRMKYQVEMMILPSWNQEATIIPS